MFSCIENYDLNFSFSDIESDVDILNKSGKFFQLHPKQLQTKTVTTKMATNETKMATVKVQNGHTPKWPKQKRPHQKGGEST